ncbi:hypothetical protein FA13DRAFT_1813878 [Coprinellus micaceus]|uniref:Uncharacterized protein n=1 Tax=Coprinellus micaceus TaxID=71717 RepID=A0A4Y7TCK1_COPMI|nr:hypothetical protein FA13DRAFT_1813878 [Coprinellus micaceus]
MPAIRPAFTRIHPIFLRHYLFLKPSRPASKHRSMRSTGSESSSSREKEKGRGVVRGTKQNDREAKEHGHGHGWMLGGPWRHGEGPQQQKAKCYDYDDDYDYCGPCGHAEELSPPRPTPQGNHGHVTARGREYSFGGAEGNGGLTSTSRGPRIGADSRKEHLRDPLRPESNFRESQKRMGEENGGEQGKQRKKSNFIKRAMGGPQEFREQYDT